MATDQDTFTFLPLHMDPQSKAILAPGGAAAAAASPTPGALSSGTRALAAELEALNALHRSLLSLDSPHVVPPPPVPVNPKRSANIKKLRESGNDAFKAGRYPDAIKNYTLGLQMALRRPAWEPSGLIRDESAMLFANRAQAHMELRNWVDGSVDAECSVEAKKVGNPKAWYRRGRCLFEMGRYEEAREWVGKGLEMEGEDGELIKLLKEIDVKLPK